MGGWPAGPPLSDDDLLAIQRQLAHEATGRLDRLCAQLGVKGINFSWDQTPCVQSPPAHQLFQRLLAPGQSFLPQTVFVGGTVAPPQGDPPGWLADIPADQPLGLVTLGSTFTGDLTFFSRGAEAIARGGMIPLVVIGYNRSRRTRRRCSSTTCRAARAYSTGWTTTTFSRA